MGRFGRKKANPRDPRALGIRATIMFCDFFQVKSQKKHGRFYSHPWLEESL